MFLCTTLHTNLMFDKLVRVYKVPMGRCVRRLLFCDLDTWRGSGRAAAQLKQQGRSVCGARESATNTQRAASHGVATLERPCVGVLAEAGGTGTAISLAKLRKASCVLSPSKES